MLNQCIKIWQHSPLIGSKTQLQYLRSMPLPSPFEKFNKKYVLFLFFSSYLLTFACLNFFILCRSFLLHAMIPRNHFCWNSNNFGNSTKDGTLNLRENLVQRFWWSRSTISIKNRWRYWSFFTAIYGIFSSSRANFIPLFLLGMFQHQ